MAQGRQLALLNAPNLTDGALLTIGQAGFGTSSSLAGNVYDVMAQGRQLALLNAPLPTYGTLFAIAQASIRTSRILTGNMDPIVEGLLAEQAHAVINSMVVIYGQDFLGENLVANLTDGLLVAFLSTGSLENIQAGLAMLLRQLCLIVMLPGTTGVITLRPDVSRCLAIAFHFLNNHKVVFGVGFVCELLTAQFLAADGAVYNLVVVDLCTVGLIQVLDHRIASSVAQSGDSDSLTAQFCIANGTVNHIVVATIVDAVGSNVVLNNDFALGMAQSGNSDGLAADHFATDSTIDDIVIAAASSTGGINVVLNNGLAGSMVSTINRYGFTAQFYTANSTVNDLVITAFGDTTGCDTVLDHNLTGSMAICGNSDGLAAQFLTADGAVNHIVVAAIVDAIGSNVVFHNDFALSVAQSGNSDGLTAQFLTTLGAIYDVVIAAGVGAVGSDFVFDDHIACEVALNSKRGGFGLCDQLITGIIRQGNNCVDGICTNDHLRNAADSDIHNASIRQQIALMIIVVHSIGQFGIIITTIDGDIIQNDFNADGFDLQDGFGSSGGVVLGVSDSINLILTNLAGQLAVDHDGAVGGQGLQLSLGGCQSLQNILRQVHLLQFADQFDDGSSQFFAIVLLDDGRQLHIAVKLHIQDSGQGVQQILCIFIQQNVDDVILAVDNDGNIVRTVGILNVDHLAIAIEGNGGIDQIEDHIILFDNQQAGIGGGIVVRIGNDTIVEVVAGLGVGHVIVEGQSHILGQLLQDGEQLVDISIQLLDVGIDRILSNAQGNQFFNRDQGHQIIPVRTDEIDQVSSINALVLELVLSKSLVQPLGEVDVDIAMECIHADLADIAGHISAAGDQRVIGLQTGNSGAGNDRNGMAVAIVIDGAAGDIDGGISGLNSHDTSSGADCQQVAVRIVTGVDSDDGVDTGMNRSLRGSIGLAVGLHASVVELHFALRGDHDIAVDGHLDIHSVTGIVELEDTVVVHVAVFIHEFHIGSIGHDQHRTRDQVADVHCAIELQLNVSNLNVGAVGQVFGVGIDLQFAIVVNGDELMLDQSGGILVENAIFVCGSIQVEELQQFTGPDVIFVLVIPLQFHFGNIGGDDQQTGIHGGIMVGIRDHSDDDVCADFGDLHIVLEGQFGILRHLLQGRDHIIDGVGQGVEDLRGSALLFQSGSDLRQLCQQLIGELTNGDAVDDAGSILSDQLVDPSGEVHIDSAADSIPADLAEGTVGADTGSDDGGVDIQIRVSRGLSVDLVLGIMGHAGCHGLDLVGHFDRRVGRLDHQDTGIHAEVLEVTVRIFGVNSDRGVNTGMNRLFCAVVDLAVGLDANIGNSQPFGRTATVGVDQLIAGSIGNQHIEAQGLIVEYLMQIVIRLMRVAAELHVNGLGHNQEGADNGHSIVDLVAPVEHIRDLHISAIVGDGIIAGPDVGLDVAIDVGGQELAGLIVDTQDQVLDVTVGGVQHITGQGFGLDHVGAHQIRKDLLIGGQGHDHVLIGVIPLQLGLNGLGSDDQVIGGVSSLEVGIDSDRAGDINTDVGGMEVLVLDDNLDIHVVGDAGDGFDNLVQDIHRAFVNAQNIGQAVDQVSKLTQGEFALQVLANQRQIADRLGQTELDIADRLVDTHSLILDIHIQQLAHIQADDELDAVDLRGRAVRHHGGADGQRKVVGITKGDKLGIVVDGAGSLLDSHIDGDLGRLVVLIAREVQGDGLCACVLIQIVGLDLQAGNRSAVGSLDDLRAGSGDQLIQAVAEGDFAVNSVDLGLLAVVMDGNIGDYLSQQVLIVFIAEADGLGGAITGGAKDMGADGQALQLLGNVTDRIGSSQLTMGNLINDISHQFVQQLFHVVLGDFGIGIQPQFTQFDIEGTQFNDGEAQVNIGQFDGNCTLFAGQVFQQNLFKVDFLGILGNSFNDVAVIGLINAGSEIVFTLVFQNPEGVNSLNNNFVMFLLVQNHREGSDLLAVSQLDLHAVDGNALDRLAGNGGELEVVGTVTDHGVDAGSGIQRHDLAIVIGDDIRSVLDGDLDGGIVGDIGNGNILESLGSGLVVSGAIIGDGNGGKEAIFFVASDGVGHGVVHIECGTVGQDTQAQSFLQLSDQLGLVNILNLLSGDGASHGGRSTQVNQRYVCGVSNRIVGLVAISGLPSDTNLNFSTVVQSQQSFVRNSGPAVIDQRSGEINGESAAVGCQECSSFALTQDGIDQILCRGNLSSVVLAALVHLHLEAGILRIQLQDAVLDNDLVSLIGSQVEGNGSIVQHGIHAAQDAFQAQLALIANQSSLDNIAVLVTNSDGLDISHGVGIGAVVHLLQGIQESAVGSQGDGQAGALLEVVDTQILTGIFAELGLDGSVGTVGNGLNLHSDIIAGVEDVQNDLLLEGAVLSIGVGQLDGLGAALTELVADAVQVDGGILGNVCPQVNNNMAVLEFQLNIVLGHGSGRTAEDRIKDQLLQIVSVILIVHAVDDGLISLQIQVVHGVGGGDHVLVSLSRTVGGEGHGSLLIAVRNVVRGESHPHIAVLGDSDGLNNIVAAGSDFNSNGGVTGNLNRIRAVEGSTVNCQATVGSQIAVSGNSAIVVRLVNLFIGDGDISSLIGGITCKAYSVGYGGQFTGVSGQRTCRDCRSTQFQVANHSLDISKDVVVGHIAQILLLGDSQIGIGQFIAAVNHLHGNSLGDSNAVLGVADREAVRALVQLVSEERILINQRIYPSFCIQNSIAVLDGNSASDVQRLNTNHSSNNVVTVGVEACSLENIGSQSSQSRLVRLIGIVLVNLDRTVGGVHGNSTECNVQLSANVNGGGSADHIVNVAVGSVGIDQAGGNIDNLVGNVGGIPQVGIDVAILAQQSCVASGGQGNVAVASLHQSDSAGLQFVKDAVFVCVINQNVLAILINSSLFCHTADNSQICGSGKGNVSTQLQSASKSLAIEIQRNAVIHNRFSNGGILQQSNSIALGCCCKCICQISKVLSLLAVSGNHGNAVVLELIGCNADLISNVAIFVFSEDLQFQSNFQVGVRSQELGSEVDTAVEVLNDCSDLCQSETKSGLSHNLGSSLHDIEALAVLYGDIIERNGNPVFAPSIVLTSQIAICAAVSVEGNALVGQTADGQNIVGIPVAVLAHQGIKIILREALDILNGEVQSEGQVGIIFSQGVLDVSDNDLRQWNVNIVSAVLVVKLIGIGNACVFTNRQVCRTVYTNFAGRNIDVAHDGAFIFNIQVTLNSNDLATSNSQGIAVQIKGCRRSSLLSPHKENVCGHSCVSQELHDVSIIEIQRLRGFAALAVTDQISLGIQNLNAEIGIAILIQRLIHIGIGIAGLLECNGTSELCTLSSNDTGAAGNRGAVA